jgi:hypothetical protein
MNPFLISTNSQLSKELKYLDKRYVLSQFSLNISLDNPYLIGYDARIGS